MDHIEAEKLLSAYEYELWWRTKYSGNHPSEDNDHEEMLYTLRQQIIKELTDKRLPLG